MNTETGTLEFIGEIIPVSDKFQKREIVIKQVFNGRTGPYENFIRFQLLQEKVTHIDQFPLGSTIAVSYDLKGRKVEKDGETRYYTNIDAWKIEAAQIQAAPGSAAPGAAPAASASTGTAAPGATGPVPSGGVAPPVEGVAPKGEGHDDLPF